MESRRWLVIKFLAKPFNGIDEFVCVPESWLRWDISDYIVGVAYPVVDPELTGQRDRDYEDNLSNWNAYRAVIIRTMDSYDDAMRYITILSGVPTEVPDSMAEVTDLIGDINIDDGSTVSEAVTKTCKEFNTRKLEAVPSSPKGVTPKSKNKSKDKHDSSNDEPSTSKGAIPKVKSQVKTKRTPEKDSKTTSDKTTETPPSSKGVSPKVKDETKKMRDSIKDSSPSSPLEGKKLNSSDKTKETKNSSNDKPAPQTPSTPTVIKKETLGIEEEPFVTPRTKRNITNSFHRTPSKEYLYIEENTLLNPREAPGLRELISGSGVYVNGLVLQSFLNNIPAEELTENEADTIRRRENVLREIIKLLMEQIFIVPARTTCSLFGAQPVAFDPNETDVRPGLHEIARSAILEYVRRYGNSRGWDLSMQFIVKEMQRELEKARRDARRGS